jgi:3-phosphoshikimate 1-carboxyvinyltransferase
MDMTLSPVNQVSGTITVPSSKSQTIRALLVATFAHGRSIIHNPLDSQDTRSCIDACRAFGAVIQPLETEGLVVESPVSYPSKITIDCGNSGTTLYLASGLGAHIGSPVTFTGDAQLKNRPVKPLLEALSDLGAVITYPEDNSREGYPPFTITGPLTGGETSIVCHTSQHLSALLLACPLATGDSKVTVPLLNERPYVHMTRSWLDMQDIEYRTDDAMDRFDIPGRQSFSPFETTVQGDYSSASFFFCAAAVAGGCVTIKGLDPKDPQGDKEILEILERMGCAIDWIEPRTVRVQGPHKGGLLSGTFDLNAIPDALPILAVTACYAQGTTVLGNVPQARIKETDRIAVMHENLASLGAAIEETEDALIIHGTGLLKGGSCKGYDDHRVIMAMAIASLACDDQLTIHGTDAVGVTFPTFFTLLQDICIPTGEETT